ncbi:MAG: recombinase family protein [Ilumatobacteraceae bacterium]
MHHRRNAEQGKAHGGGRPFGYERHETKRGALVVVPAEAELIREAADRILRGSSLNAIVIDWNDRSIPTVKGNKWRPNSLSKLLRSGRIAGLREVDGEVLGEGIWEPILPREKWERVRSRITHAPIGRRPRRNLLAGMVVCGRCGAKMRAETGGNDRYRGRQYSCDKAVRHGCGSNSAKAEHVEAIVVAHILAALHGVNLAQARARRTVQSSSTIVASIAADEQMLSDLAADLGARRIARAEWLAARQPIEDRLADNRRALEQVAADSDLDDAAFEGLGVDRWEELDLDQQRAVLRLFIERVEITKGKPGRTFDPSRVRIVPVGLSDLSPTDPPEEMEP